MRKKLTLLATLLFIGLNWVFAQTMVKGKVSDKSGQPLPGVTIKVAGSILTTITDVSGNYSISAGPNASLVFTYIGFAPQTIAVSNQTVLNVTLTEETNNLNDVVVVGYGTQKKSVLTGSVTGLKGRDLENQQVIRVDQALQGRTSGVAVVANSGAPGAGVTVRVRGVTSINNSEPLYVVDGVVVLNGGIDNINPNDIESMEVLKDASAAIYGSRSSAGVILVTTKKGKPGAPQINYSGYVGIQNPVSRYKMVNASQYAALRNQSLVNDGVPASSNSYFDGHDANHPTPANAGTGTNWQDEIFGSNALIQSHTLGIQGGTDKSSYYLSFGYLNQKGIIFSDVSNYKRYNFAVNSSSKLKKWLTIGENFSYAYNRNQGGVNTNSEFGGPLSSALNLDPITPVLYNGVIAQTSAYTTFPVIRDANGTPYSISQLVGQELSNPRAFLQTQLGNYGWSHNLLGNAYVEIAPIAGLKIRSQINGKQAFYGSQSFTPLYYLTTQNNNTSQNSANRSSNRNLTYNWDNTISYEKVVGLHSFSALAGTSVQSQNAVGLGTNYFGLPITSYKDLSFNFNLPRTSREGYSSEDQPYRTFSYFGRLNYDYDQKYLFTGIIRRDGSSKFGSNNVYGVFPSASVGWVASRESFFPKNSFVDFFKLRGSYGIVGNEQSLGTFQYTSVVGGGRNYVFGNDVLAIGNSPLSPPNPDLKWETVRTTDIGFDAVIFKNFNVTFDVYRKLTKGMIQGVPLPAYGGYDSPYFANVGNLENKGIELELGYNKTFGDVRFSANGNIAYNKNNITYLGLTQFYENGTFQNIGYQIFRTAVGQPVNSFYGFQTMGVFHSQAEIDAYAKNGNKIQPNAKPGDLKYQDTDGSGTIGQEDRVFLGSQLPTWTYGLTLNANYKNFDLKIFGQGVWGNKIYQGYRRLDVANANYGVEALDAWTPSNSSSNIPRLTDADPNKNTSYPSDYHLQSGAYFRIRTAQIGYTIPKTIVSKLSLQNIRFYVSSNNLATITKYNGFDPEISGGIDRGLYPQSRSFLLGLNVNF